MRIKKTLFSTEIEITPEEANQMMHGHPDLVVAFRESFGAFLWYSLIPKKVREYLSVQKEEKENMGFTVTQKKERSDI